MRPRVCANPCLCLNISILLVSRVCHPFPAVSPSACLVASFVGLRTLQLVCALTLFCLYVSILSSYLPFTDGLFLVLVPRKSVPTNQTRPPIRLVLLICRHETHTATTLLCLSSYFCSCPPHNLLYLVYLISSLSLSPVVFCSSPYPFVDRSHSARYRVPLRCLEHGFADVTAAS